MFDEITQQLLKELEVPVEYCDLSDDEIRMIEEESRNDLFADFDEELLEIDF